MIKALLVRGMLAGVMAGLLAFGFAQVFGEPAIDYAIDLEAQVAQAMQGQHPATASHEHENEPVSRAVQAGAGLLTAVVVYGRGSEASSPSSLPSPMGGSGGWVRALPPGFWRRPDLCLSPWCLS